MGNQIYSNLTTSPLQLLNSLGFSNGPPLSKRGILKSYKCHQQNGLCVTVKIYWKSQDSVEKIVLQSKKILLNALLDRFQLIKQPNILNYHRAFENEKAICLIRQYCYISLMDRISTRPFLSQMNKLWISYQILQGLTQMKESRFFHGDIKMSNVLLTTYDWVFLTDLSFYKPFYIPPNNPSTFVEYFSNAESSAFLAPERFQDQENSQIEVALRSSETESQQEQTKKDLASLHAMDIFSAGCVIGQLFLDVRALFTFEQLLAYRNGSTTHLDESLNRIKNDHLRKLLFHMLNVDPTKRFSSDEYIDKWTPNLFPYFFEPLHKIASQMIIMSCDERIEKLYLSYNDIVEKIIRNKPTTDDVDDILSLLQQNILHVEELPRVGCSYDEDLEPLNDKIQTEGIEILASIICASLINVEKIENKIRVLHLMQSIAHHSTDYVRLQRLIPYCCTIFSANDVEPLVKCTAIQTLAIILKTIQNIPLSESNLFTDYILAKLKKLANDESDMVCICFAEHLPFFATHAKRFLDISVNDQKKSLIDESISYEETLSKLQSDFMQMIKSVSTHQKIFVKIGLLENIVDICQFYGISKTCEDVLPMLITFLNSKPWRLRYSFFKKIVPISLYIGQLPVQQYIIPCILQALNDSAEQVVEQAITDFDLLCKNGMLKRSAILDISKRILPTLHHPNIWIRNATISFIASASEKLGPVDSACFLVTELYPHLENKILNLTIENLKQCIKTHLPRKLFDKVTKLKFEDIQTLRRNGQNTKESWMDVLEIKSLSDEEYIILELMSPYLITYTNAQFSKSYDPNSNFEDKPPNIKEEIEMEPNKVSTIINADKVRQRSVSSAQKQLTQVDKLCGLMEKKEIVNFQPRGDFCGQNHQHNGPILSIGVHPSLKWFASGGKDKNIRIWDLEKCYTESSIVSKIAYTIDGSYGYIQSICSFSDSNEESYVAFGTSSGWVFLIDANNYQKEIFKIQITKDGKCKFKEISKEYDLIDQPGISVLHYIVLKGIPHLLCGTQSGVIVALDAFSGGYLFTLKEENHYEEGGITAICGDSIWIVSGTNRGFLSLWDLRFRFQFRSLHWRLSNICLNPYSGISSLGVKENSSNGESAPSIIIATKSRDIVIWNLDTQRETLILRLSDPKESQNLSKESSEIDTEINQELNLNEDDLYAISEWKQLAKENRKDVQLTSMYVNSDGSLFSGSTDRIIRHWTPELSSNSRIVCPQNYEAIYNKINSFPPICEEKILNTNSIFNGLHADSITNVKVVLLGDIPTLVSSSRDGVIMFWR